jgi:hypothetical protein
MAHCEGRGLVFQGSIMANVAKKEYRNHGMLSNIIIPRDEGWEEVLEDVQN